eukprot:10070815-Alexandrium_andersonii.AAC.1
MTARWLTRVFVWQAGLSCVGAGASGPWTLITASCGGKVQPVRLDGARWRARACRSRRARGRRCPA